MLDRAFYTETLILLRWALKYKTNNIFRNVSFIYEHPIDCFPLIILIIRIFLVIKTVITFVLETWFISSVHRRELLNNSPCLHVVCFSFLCVCVCGCTSLTQSLSLTCSADLWWSGLDPGGLHPGGATEPSGLGHVCLCLLLRHDLHLDDGVCLRGTQQPQQLGSSCE